MIEVIVSTLLVAIIAVGTLTGFESAGRASADQRTQAQAAVLAAQDEERLRGLKATQLGQIGSSTEPQTVSDTGQCIEEVSSAWRYCEGAAAYQGTVFTITSSAEYVSASTEKLTCKATPGSADYLQTTSEVTWPGVRTPVKQSSVVTNPLKTALLVKVVNQINEPVEGVAVKVTGTGVNAEQTTGEAGCVVFGALPDKAMLSVTAVKSGWIDHQGETPPAKSVTVSSSTLTEVPFTIAQSGGLSVEFESNGTTGISGDTFSAVQAGISEPNNYIEGTPGTPATKLTLTGLFPFATPGKPPTENPYTIYAGDCEANNPEKVTSGAVKDKTAQVEPNTVAPAKKVELPAVNITVKSGTKAGAGTEGVNVTSSSAKIINTACAGKKARNRASINAEHVVAILNGKLEPKYQPYAASLELCVAFTEGIGASLKYYRNKTTIANTAKAGTAATVFYVKGGAPSSSSSALTC